MSIIIAHNVWRRGNTSKKWNARSVIRKETSSGRRGRTLFQDRGANLHGKVEAMNAGSGEAGSGLRISAGTCVAKLS
jgi:hypothetical protein